MAVQGYTLYISLIKIKQICYLKKPTVNHEELDVLKNHC